MDNVENFYPLSPMQQGLLFHSLYDPEAGAYFEQFHCVLRGELDAAAWRRAWQQCVARHAVLRTAFVWQDVPEPVQVVLRDAELPWEEQDWRALAPGEQEERFRLFLAEDRRRGFDLSAAPLMRMALLRLDDGAHRFLWSHHHLLLDGWSVPLLVGEVLAFYAANRRGEQLRLPPPAPYRNYIAWLRRRDLTEAERFWRGALAGFTSPTRLGIERAHAASRAHGGRRHRVQRLLLSEAETSALETLGRRLRVTLNTIIQGGWALLLGRYSGRDDVVFGATVSGRPAEVKGVESMLGLFINTLPVRARVGEERPLADWLRELQEQQVRAREYEYSPLVEVQGWSEVRRGVPLFETLLVFENYPIETVLGRAGGGEGADAALTFTDISSVEGGNYPLSVTVMPGRELSMQATYDGDRCDDESVARLFGHFRRLLASMAAGPSLFLSELRMLAEAEERLLLIEWGNARARRASAPPVHELFEAQAAAEPGAPAVISESASLTYAELDGRANRLARRLRELGAGPETLVALLSDRSPEMLVAVLGILKAGAAYVPLDPAYPLERLRYMLEDSGAKILLTRQPLAEAPPTPGLRVVCLETEAAEIDRCGADALGVRVEPESLAYVMYTSGSTGRPKGVGLPHGALADFAVTLAGELSLGPGDRFLQFASLSFDVSAEEVFPALASGAAVVTVPEPPSVLDLLPLVERERLTVFELPTAFWHEWVNELAGEGSRLPGFVRAVIVGGENALPRAVSAWRRVAAPETRLLNVYGLTETAVTSTVYRLADDGRDPEAILPIGRPLGNTRAYLLDGRMRPVPVGVPGELYVGGGVLARGYHERRALTAERFVPDPLSGEPGARLYRTGDLARYLAGGDLEFLGRVDRQTKVRGFRIELDEIENVLGGHEAVSQCAVTVFEVGPHEKRLAAYVAVEPGRTATVGELRDYLAARLPDYMVPSSFVRLAELPLAANGKVDRLALPAPDRGRGEEVEADFAAPRDEVEAALAGIWSDVLRRDGIGVHDDFFQLGGHSLLATQVVSRIRQRFGVELPLRHVFEQPTIAALARLVSRGGGDGAPGDADDGFAAAADDNPERLLERIDELSDEEVEALLGDMAGE